MSEEYFKREFVSDRKSGMPTFLHESTKLKHFFHLTNRRHE